MTGSSQSPIIQTISDRTLGMDKKQTRQKVSEADVPLLHPKGIREHTDGREFRPYGLLAVTLIIASVLAAICYGIQLYFIGPG
ncbi:MAG: hypothetical protein V7745_07255 [Pseudomonadales bacterium]